MISYSVRIQKDTPVVLMLLVPSETSVPTALSPRVYYPPSIFLLFLFRLTDSGHFFLYSRSENTRYPLPASVTRGTLMLDFIMSDDMMTSDFLMLGGSIR